MHCTGCGDKLAEQSAFCTSCGRQVNNSGSSSTSTEFGSTSSTSFAGAAPMPSSSQAQAYTDQKSKLVAGLLAVLGLGIFGVHNFYLGFNGKAITQLVLTLIGFVLIIPLIITSIWGLVDGIMILCTPNGKDAKGVPLKD